MAGHLTLLHRDFHSTTDLLPRVWLAERIDADFSHAEASSSSHHYIFMTLHNKYENYSKTLI